MVGMENKTLIWCESMKSPETPQNHLLVELRKATGVGLPRWLPQGHVGKPLSRVRIAHTKFIAILDSTWRFWQLSSKSWFWYT